MRYLGCGKFEPADTPRPPPGTCEVFLRVCTAAYVTAACALRQGYRLCRNWTISPRSVGSVAAQVASTQVCATVESSAEPTSAPTSKRTLKPRPCLDFSQENCLNQRYDDIAELGACGSETARSSLGAQH